MRLHWLCFFAATKRKKNQKTIFMKMYLFIGALLMILTGNVVSAQTNVKQVYNVDTTERDNSFAVQISTDDDAQKFLLIVNNPAAEKLRINIAGPEGVGFSDQT